MPKLKEGADDALNEVRRAAPHRVDHGPFFGVEKGLMSVSANGWKTRLSTRRLTTKSWSRPT